MPNKNIKLKMVCVPREDKNLYTHLGNLFSIVPSTQPPYHLRQIDSINPLIVENKKCRWEEALRKSAKPLEERGTINEQYIESIIDSLRYYGPYMFITKDVVLAHSQPKDNVNDLGVSIGVFKEQVQFSNFHHCHVCKRPGKTS